jgi:hypothetical protein
VSFKIFCFSFLIFFETEGQQSQRQYYHTEKKTRPHQGEAADCVVQFILALAVLAFCLKNKIK